MRRLRKLRLRPAVDLSSHQPQESNQPLERYTLLRPGWQNNHIELIACQFGEASRMLLLKKFYCVEG